MDLINNGYSKWVAICSWKELCRVQHKRKNWLSPGSPAGANASALLFSLIETAKANDLNPYGYLRWIFEQTPLLKSDKDFEKIFPWNCDRDEINRIKFHGL